MKKPVNTSSRSELRQALALSRHSLVSIGLFSFFLNLLTFTGPLFMLQVYDRVLTSRSEETLVVLCMLMAALFVIQGILDHVRARMAVRIGARFQEKLDRRVFGLTLDRADLAAKGIDSGSAMTDLDSIRRALSSQAVFTVFDIPWIPVFTLVIFSFHPTMGWLAVTGAGILATIAILNHVGTRDQEVKLLQATRNSEEMTILLQQNSDTARATGVRSFVTDRWKSTRDLALEAGVRHNDHSGLYATSSRTFRIFLQSAVLALGAWLVLRHEITGGSMIAAMILVGRGLQPIESIIGQWTVMQRAVGGWHRLNALMAKVPADMKKTVLPAPKALLFVDRIAAVPPGERLATLNGVSFQLLPGQALAVMGQSGAGKSTLARALTGIWPLVSGEVRLDAATLGQYDPDMLPNYIGYLSQDVTLFKGTIAENIARMAMNPDADKVISAAKKAAAHEMILSLPFGYDTPISTMTSRLSGGQRQRIGLARALYGDPVILVLDEPNSNLDAEGSMALNLAIRQTKAHGGAVIIMAHRPAAIEECDLLLILERGKMVALGPRDEILRKHLRPLPQMVQPGQKPAGSR